MTIESMQSMSGQMPNMQEILEGWKNSPTEMLEGLGEFAPDLQEQLTEEFDTDGNGELSDEEMSALQEKMVAMHEMMAQMTQMSNSQQGGAPMGPPPDAEEILAGWQDDPDAMLADLAENNTELYDKLMNEFDSDGDGELSEDEMDALQSRMIDVAEDMVAGVAPPSMQAAGGAGSASGDDEDEDEFDAVSTLMDALSESESVDAADADENGVVTEQELADYLGVSIDDLDAVRSGRGQRAETGEQDGGGFGKDAMAKAIDAYLTNIQGGLTDSALSAFGAGAVDATA